MEEIGIFMLCLFVASSWCAPPSVTRRYRSDYVYNGGMDAFYKLHTESRRGWTLQTVRSAPKKTIYKEFLNSRTQTSVWKHFLRAEDGQSVECKHCKKILKTPGGATGALHTHIRAKHTDKVSQDQDIQTASTSNSKSSQLHEKDIIDQTPTKKIKLTDFFFSDSSMEVRVTRMAAVDGIPLSKFCTSEDLRYVFKKAGYELPKSPSTITKIVQEQAVAIKNKVKNKLKEMKSQNERFAITLDEWTSTRNRRYMNINIHSTNLKPAMYINLGLVRIKGSMPAQVGLELLRQHLIEFDLNLEDIISLTTDGASVMVKMGKLYGGLHQLCLAHGIQLAVFNVLYKKTSTPVINHDESSDTDDDGIVEDSDGFYLEVPKISEPEIMYKDAIDKVRSLVKSFKKSPMKNDLLQKYSAEEFGLSLDLILDCKTRWNSLSDMVERFLKLKSSVFKTAVDLKLIINTTEKDIQQLENIHCSLEVIKVTVMALCRRDTNLLTADTAIHFMLQKLDSQPNELSRNLAVSLRQKIKERRTIASSVLQYLHNNEGFFNAAETETFTKPSADEIRTFITSLLERINFNTPDSEPNFRNEAQSLIKDRKSCGEKDPTIANQLHEEMMKTMARTQVETPAINTDIDSIVRVEMCIYDSAGGGRGVFLTAAYNYLMQITPTSVEAERAFSSAGYLCTKICESEGASLMVPATQEDIIQVHSMFKKFPDLGQYVFVASDGRDHESAEETPIINLTEDEDTNSWFPASGCDVLTRSAEIDSMPCYMELPFVCKVEAKDAPYDAQCDLLATGYEYNATVGSCYKIPRRIGSWNEAYAECRAEGAHLVVLNSRAEMELVHKLMQDSPDIAGVQASWFFFAGFRATPPAANETVQWKTIFNQTLPDAGFAEWSPGEPNNALNEEYCGTLFKNDGLLNDVFCDHIYAFICEKEVTSK